MASLLLVCPHTLPSLSSGKGKADGESLTHLVCKATIAALCDSLIGQALGMSMEAIWTSE